MEQILYQASVWVLPVLLAATFHEAAHAWAAWRLGDDTAHSLGRVSFDPFRHVDAFGTVLLPAFLLLTHAPFLFGWARAVPVNVQALRNRERDFAIVSVAGPAANLGLAFVSGLMMHLLPVLPDFVSEWAKLNLYHSLVLNVLLAVFNMLPVPPLDGGRVAIALLPRPLGERLAQVEPYGICILVLLLFVLPLTAGNPDTGNGLADLFIETPAKFLIDVVMTLTGVV